MKNIPVSFMWFVITVVSACNQTSNIESEKIKACNSDLVYTIVEVTPKYKGGYSQLESDLNEKLELDKKIDGTTFIKFIVNCTGNAYGFEIIKGVEKETDKKLISEFSKLQNWVSGTHNNQKIACDQIAIFAIRNGRLTVKPVATGK